MVFSVKRVMTQHLDHPAICDGALGELGDHPFQSGLQRRRPHNTNLYRGKLLRRDNVRRSAGLVRFVGGVEQIADCLQWNPKVARAAGEGQLI